MCGGGGGGGGRLRDWVEVDRYLGQQKPPADTADREDGNGRHMAPVGGRGLVSEKGHSEPGAHPYRLCWRVADDG